MIRKWRGCAGLLALAMTPAIAMADVVTDWNNVIQDAIRTGSTPPPIASRAMAILHAAVYDAVIAIEGGYEPYHADIDAAEGASVEAAVAQASHDTLVALFPDQTETFDAALEAALADIADGAGKDDGVAVGAAAAADILAMRADDHSADIVTYTPGEAVGDWVPTPPGNAPALLPQWPDVTPFALILGDQFRPGGPPALTSEEYATAYDEVKALGRVDSATRTADQTEIAQFWANGAGTNTPPGHWNAIAQVIAADQGNTLVENARLFALLNIALADAAITAWDAKYAYNHWRPVTAIVNADLDGNDATESDAEWTPLLTTPPFPEYISGHSTFSGAGAKVLERFYGRDDISFMADSDGLPGTFRNFTSLSQAADESGRSRIYGGIHFEYANQDGLRSGGDIGDYAFDNYLKAVEDGSTGGGVRICGALSFGNFAALSLGLMFMRAGSRRVRAS